MKNLNHNGNDSTKETVSNYRGIELVFGITSSGWYASRASFGQYEVKLQHEYDSTMRWHYKIIIMPCVPEGNHQFYIGETPMSLYLEDGREPRINTLTNTLWCNSQSWKYVQIQDLTIKEGWIFIDGKDVFENTKKIIDELQLAQKTARSNKFEELSKTVTEKYGEEIFKMVLRKKGVVLSILKTLSENKVQVEVADLKKILTLSSSAPVIANLMICVAADIDVFKAAKIAEKAYAWAYLNNTFPGMEFIGYFDDAKEALRIFSENWSYQSRNFQTEKGNTIGDFFSK